MAETPVTITVHVDGLDVTRELLEHARKLAFVAGLRACEDAQMTEPIMSDETVNDLYAEWVKKVESDVVPD